VGPRGAIAGWLDERTGWRRMVEVVFQEPVPGGARLRYVFGSVLTYLFVQQVVLGIALAFHYVPSTTGAWASTAWIQDQLAFGWFVRGLHHHGSSAMVVVLALHFGQVVLAGAYRAPREVLWWTGLALAGLVLAFALTGYLLPWDQSGYWATRVATGIAGSIPGVGEPLQRLLQGGSDYGNATVGRFFALHVFVLPIALAGLLAAHIALFRRHGVTPPVSLDDAAAERRRAWFWPDQLAWDVGAMAVTAGVLVWSTVRDHGAPLSAPADPASEFPARPEWYFLFLFRLLEWFEGPLEIVPTVVLPGAVLLYLAALPWVDRAPDRTIRRRWRVLSVLSLGMLGVVGLTMLALIEDARDQTHQAALAEARRQADRARALALDGVPPEGGTAVFGNDPRHGAIEDFRAHCAPCHTLEGVAVGGDEAPELTGFSGRAWLAGAIRDPGSRRYFGGTKHHDEMEPYGTDELSDADLAAVVEYLVSLRAQATGERVESGLSARGRELWRSSLDCDGCHPVTAQAGDAPSFHGRGTRAWIARVIADSSAPELYGAQAEMPRFGDELGPQRIAALADLVHAQGLAVDSTPPPP
jgi:ubiquinol-cytochrome c reductase cytochrome b subunit